MKKTAPLLKVPVVLRLQKGAAPFIAKQLRDQGFHYDPVEARLWQQKADAISLLQDAKLLTAYEAQLARERLRKYIIDGLRLIMIENHNILSRKQDSRI